jgi:hypothetical protein
MRLPVAQSKHATVSDVFTETQCIFLFISFFKAIFFSIFLFFYELAPCFKGMTIEQIKVLD